MFAQVAVRSNLMPCWTHRVGFLLHPINVCSHSTKPEEKSKPVSPRVQEFRKMLREKTPIGKLDQFDKHPYEEKEPLPPWPDNTNPHTGEIGGPRGPEPTRYGDWERKGKVSDF